MSENKMSFDDFIEFCQREYPELGIRKCEPGEEGMKFPSFEELFGDLIHNGYMEVPALFDERKRDQREIEQR